MRSKKTNGLLPCKRSPFPRLCDGTGQTQFLSQQLRHGLLACTVVLETESQEKFLDLLKDDTDEFQPATASQITMVETMTVARWRQLRVWAAQKTAMDRDMALQDPSVGPPPVQALSSFRGSSESSCPHELLPRYDVFFDRQFSRALRNLLTLQKTVPPPPPPPLPSRDSNGAETEPRGQQAATTPSALPSRDTADLPPAKRSQQLTENTPRGTHALPPSVQVSLG